MFYHCPWTREGSNLFVSFLLFIGEAHGRKKRKHQRTQARAGCRAHRHGELERAAGCAAASRRAALQLDLGMAKNLFDLPARLGSQLAVQPERTEGYSFHDKSIKVTLIPPTPFPCSS